MAKADGKFYHAPLRPRFSELRQEVLLHSVHGDVPFSVALINSPYQCDERKATFSWFPISNRLLSKYSSDQSQFHYTVSETDTVDKSLIQLAFFNRNTVTDRISGDKSGKRHYTLSGLSKYNCTSERRKQRVPTSQ